MIKAPDAWFVFDMAQKIPSLLWHCHLVNIASLENPPILHVVAEDADTAEDAFNRACQKIVDKEFTVY